MGVDERGPDARAIIVLQGGGRLEHVAEIVDVRLEADPLRWEPAGPGEIAVRGALRAYVYCRAARSRAVEGHGFYIPYSSRVDAGSIPPEHAFPALGEVRSDHSFDPITGEFQHRITVEVVVRDKRRTEREALRELVAQEAAGPEPAGRFEAAAPPKSRDLPPAPENARCETADHEHSVSAPVGEAPEREADRAEHFDSEIPARAALWERDMEAGTAGREAFLPEEPRQKAPRPEPPRLEARRDETPAPEAVRRDGFTEESPPPPATEQEKPAGGSLVQSRKKNPIVWGPFPPPVA